MFIQKMKIAFISQEGVPAAVRGRKPQAGSKRGRPFDFSCSIQYKYGQNMNKNLQLR